MRPTPGTPAAARFSPPLPQTPDRLKNAKATVACVKVKRIPWAVAERAERAGHRLRLLVELLCPDENGGNMTDDVMQVAMTTWAAKDLPARLLAAQVGKLLNCSTDDVAILVSAGKLRALGKPKPNAVKFFSSIELITLLADREWLDEATKTISQYWRRKNARRNGLTGETLPNGSDEHRVA